MYNSVTQAVEMFKELLDTCLNDVKNETISIVEYGSLNSLSASLVKPVISTLMQRSELSQEFLAFSSSSSSLSWTVTHSDNSGTDFRPIMRQIDNPYSNSSYLNIAPNIFNSYVARPFAAQIVPPRSANVGFSLMDLHIRRTSLSAGLSSAAAAHKELHDFLNIRAIEFQKDGLFVLAFIQKGEDEVSPAISAKSTREGDNEEIQTPQFTSPFRVSSKQIKLEDCNSRRGCDYANEASILAAASLADPSASISTSTSAPTSSASLTCSETSPVVPMSRCRSGSTPCNSSLQNSNGKKSDLWASLPRLLAPCIQRLVSTGLIKSDTANLLLTVSYHDKL